jgi:hypothetical protein
MVADGWMSENVASAGCGDGFSVVVVFVDVGEGSNEEGMILMPSSTPAVPMGVGRIVM